MGKLDLGRLRAGESTIDVTLAEGAFWIGLEGPNFETCVINTMLSHILGFWNGAGKDERLPFGEAKFNVYRTLSARFDQLRTSSPRFLLPLHHAHTLRRSNGSARSRVSSTQESNTRPEERPNHLLGPR